MAKPDRQEVVRGKLERAARSYDSKETSSLTARRKRDLLVLEAYEAGMTYLQIAAVLDTTKHRVTQILARERKTRKALALEEALRAE